MRKFFLLFLIILNTTAYSSNKLSSNLLGFLIIGDVNIGYETQINESSTLITTGHIITTNSELFENAITARISSGVRFYEASLTQNIRQQFIELKLGCFFTESFAAHPTAEIYYGEFTPFSESLYWDYKIGLLRVLSSNSNQFYPSGSVNIGFYLD